MRQLSLVALAGAAALAAITPLAACHDTVPSAPGPDSSLALHFDSLSVQANAAGQTNRVAALNLVLRPLADGAIPVTLKIAQKSGGTDTATYITVGWSFATEVAVTGGDSVTDSLMVLAAWRGTNADTIVVTRIGDPTLAPNVQAELQTLGLTAGLVSDTADTATSGAVVAGNTVMVADSGAVAGQYAVFGASCTFITVKSLSNDTGTQCNREEFAWEFALRISPSDVWSLTPSASTGVVIVH